ncbi:MAG: amidophosphoribosyltransferase [Alcaligenaceae bacterium]|nr:amidophosphoribosyltransferase [Alcaligenaceae bacterium]
MCGVIGIHGCSPVNQLLYDGLLLLQHRGQDAAGIATYQNNQFHLFKAQGLVRDVFRTRNMRSLPGNSGLGQVRYPFGGSASDTEEAQPFYVNAPYGICFTHNGNLTNSQELRESLFKHDRRHINTSSNSEVLLNVFAHELYEASKSSSLQVDEIFNAITAVHNRVKGAYAVVAQIAGYGMLAFRDPNGIRPLCLGTQETSQGVEWMVASESVAIEGIGFQFVRDIAPGEAVFIDAEGNLHSRLCADNAILSPCIFEYVYFARPDSTIDGVNVYNCRLRMGELLAQKLARELRLSEIDVVMPIPDSSRPAGMELASTLDLPYREGYIKNRYVGRTFIMPGQAVRKKSVRQKLNPMRIEFKDKNILLVDDSIVRGTTSREIVTMARNAGANKVFFASAAPAVRYPNFYGIDMPDQNDLIAYGKNTQQIAEEIGADALVYQDLDDLKLAVSELNPEIARFDASCFDGDYVTGDVVLPA